MRQCGPPLLSSVRFELACLGADGAVPAIHLCHKDPAVGHAHGVRLANRPDAAHMAAVESELLHTVVLGVCDKHVRAASRHATRIAKLAVLRWGGRRALARACQFVWRPIGP